MVAEAEAAEIKRDASAKARDIIHEAEQAATQKAESIVQNARDNAKTALLQAEQTAKAEALQFVEQQANVYEAMANKARARISQAADYIVERVVN